MSDQPLIRTYYYATPLFALADVVWSAPIRAAFIPDLGVRLLYYLLCIGCAVLIHRKPQAAPFVGMAESAVNLGMLAIGVMLPVLWIADPLAGGEVDTGFASPVAVINFAIVATVLLVSFYRNQARVAEKLARAGIPGRRGGPPWS
jgi:hypothetical protein